MSNDPIDEAFVDFKCPACSQTVSFPEAWVGAPQECPRCTEIVIVPPPGDESGRLLPIPIRTPRLLLRRLAGSDRDDLLEVMSDETSFLHTELSPLDAAEVEAWIRTDRTTRLTRAGGSLCLALDLSERSKLIGFLSLHYLEEQHQQAGFLMMVNPSFRRQGFALEALQAVFEFGFRDLNLHRFAVSCDSRNVAALGLLERAGMRREGEWIEDRLVDGEWVNTVCYALLRREHDATAQLAPPNRDAPVGC